MSQENITVGSHTFTNLVALTGGGGVPPINRLEYKYHIYRRDPLQDNIPFPPTLTSELIIEPLSFLTFLFIISSVY